MNDLMERRIFKLEFERRKVRGWCVYESINAIVAVRYHTGLILENGWMPYAEELSMSQIGNAWKILWDMHKDRQELFRKMHVELEKCSIVLLYMFQEHHPEIVERMFNRSRWAFMAMHQARLAALAKEN